MKSQRLTCSSALRAVNRNFPVFTCYSSASPLLDRKADLASLTAVCWHILWVRRAKPHISALSDCYWWFNTSGTKMGSVIRTNTSRNEKWYWRTFGWQEINKWNYFLNLDPVNNNIFHSFLQICLTYTTTRVVCSQVPVERFTPVTQGSLHVC